MSPQKFHRNLKSSGENTRLRIVKSAAAAFGADGFRAATMRHIAEAADVNEITVYRYFPKKQQLYWDALDWKLNSSGVIDSLAELMNSAEDLTDLVHGMSELMMRTLDKDQSVGRLMYFTALELKSEKERVFETYIRPLLALLTARIGEWITAGKMRDVDPQSAALVIAGLILSHCNLREWLGPTSRLGPSLQDVAKDFERVCVLGLCVDRSAQ